MTKLGLASTACMNSHLIDMYSNCGSLRHAFDAFNYIPDKDASCWTSIITANVENGCPEIAVRLVLQMLNEEKFRPTSKAFLSALKVLTPFRSQQARGGAPCCSFAQGGQTALRGRSDRVRRIHQREDQRTLAREGPRQGKRTLGCPRLGRPVRTSSHAAEVVEDQNIGLEK
jgi:hypothetical protein